MIPPGSSAIASTRVKRRPVPGPLRSRPNDPCGQTVPRVIATDLDTLPRPDCVPANAGWRSRRAHGRAASPRVRRSNSHRAGATGPGSPATLIAPMASAGGPRPTGPRPRAGGSSSIQQAIVTGCAAQTSAWPICGSRLRARLPAGHGDRSSRSPRYPARQPVVAIILPDGPDFQPRRLVRSILRQQSCPNHLSEIARRTRLPQDVCLTPSPAPAPPAPELPVSAAFCWLTRLARASSQVH